MSERYQRSYTSIGSQAQAQIDQGLRSYMLGVYNYMTLGLAVTAFASLGIATWAQNDPAVFQALYASPLRWILMFAPLAFIFLFAGRLHKMTTQGATVTFLAFSAVMGVSLSWIFMVFTNASILEVFAVTSASFAGLSLYGYTTKRNLSGLGTFLIMGLIGLILASIVNLFLGSGMMAFVINVAGVLIFAGLTAYDTQKIKSMYHAGDSAHTQGAKQIHGALTLYLDFINMFMFLLQLLGNRE